MYQLRKHVNVGENHFNLTLQLSLVLEKTQNGREDDKLKVLKEVETLDKLADLFFPDN